MTATEPDWRSVWITGASSGIGLELAKMIGAQSDHVAISARSEDRLKAASADYDTLHAYPLDVTDAPAVSACVAEIEEKTGGIDVAILNAGAWTLMTVDEFDLAAIRKGVEVNYMGVMHALDALLPRMLSRGKGHIVLVASVAGYRGLPLSLAYGPTKAALINLAETLACELGPRGIKVSLVNPGFVDTPMTRDNPFPMPGLMSVEKAAAECLAGLKRSSFEVRFPWAFTSAMKILRLLPNRLYFWVVRRFIHKSPAG